MCRLSEMFVGRFVQNLFMKKYTKCSDSDVKTFSFFGQVYKICVGLKMMLTLPFLVTQLCRFFLVT